VLCRRRTASRAGARMPRRIAPRRRRPRFAAKCNQIGATLGLPPVGVKGRHGLPDCAQWPACVRPAGYYPEAPNSAGRRSFGQRLRTVEESGTKHGRGSACSPESGQARTPPRMSNLDASDRHEHDARRGGLFAAIRVRLRSPVTPSATIARSAEDSRCRPATQIWFAYLDHGTYPAHGTYR
jgi:hypothetical protein